MVHPTSPPYALPVAGVPVWVYEFPFETTRAIASLIAALAKRHGAGPDLVDLPRTSAGRFPSSPSALAHWEIR